MKFLKRLAAITIAAVTAISVTAFAETPAAPEVSAKSAVLINADTGRILYQKNQNDRMYPASMTKLLTSMVLLDNMDLDDTITIDYSINEIPWDSSKAGIAVGEVLTVENVIRGLIIPSGNDIANAAASAVAKKALGNSISYDEAEEYFTGLMNKKAKELGCTGSNFVNPHGYHDDNHYTTAYDMSLIAKAAMQYDMIREAAKETKFSGNGAGKQKYNVEGSTQEYTWYSHNELITGGANNYEYATGIKTGFTDQAGDCLAASATKENENLIAIIMNSEDPGRWQDAKNLFEWAFNNYDMIEYKPAGVAATAQLTGHNRLNGDTVDLVINNGLSEYMTAEEAAAVETKIIYDNGGELLQAPAEKGAKVGKLQFLLNGEVIGEQDAYTAKEVKKANIFNSAVYYLKVFFQKVTAKENLKYTGAVLIVILLIIIVLIMRHKRKQRYKIKGNYYNKSKTYDTSRINNSRRRKNSRRDKYNKYK
ncbi:MAG: D-alanyl-D-alanine carboxypeptidase family protein [Candidatus Metalachnospira sp.]|nr:D-alanyl-D-alanine carboxypeptidase family protein [Candidatus Metalachnospira sp.]